MTRIRKVEIIAGVATGLLTVFNPSSFVLAQFVLSSSNTNEKLLAVVSSLVTYIGPAILVAIGSYAHAHLQRTVGFGMVVLGGLILIGFGFIAFLGGLFYAFGLWWGAVALLPAGTAIVTLLAATAVSLENKSLVPNS